MERFRLSPHPAPSPANVFFRSLRARVRGRIYPFGGVDEWSGAYRRDGRSSFGELSPSCASLSDQRAHPVVGYKILTKNS